MEKILGLDLCPHYGIIRFYPFGKALEVPGKSFVRLKLYGTFDRKHLKASHYLLLR